MFQLGDQSLKLTECIFCHDLSISKIKIEMYICEDFVRNISGILLAPGKNQKTEYKLTVYYCNPCIKLCLDNK